MSSVKHKYTSNFLEKYKEVNFFNQLTFLYKINFKKKNETNNWWKHTLLKFWNTFEDKFKYKTDCFVHAFSNLSLKSKRKLFYIEKFKKEEKRQFSFI